MTRLSLRGVRNRYGIFLPSVVHKSVLRGQFDAVDRLIQLTSDKLPKYLRLAGRTTP